MFTPDRDQPDAARLDSLGETLATIAARTAHEGPWRSGAFGALGESGVLAGFVPVDCGGTGASEPALVSALIAIAERCLTTALALTQWAAAVRIISGASADVRGSLLPPLARGDASTTVGISHLTTSRRHLGTPAVAAFPDGAGWRLDGFCPWVTGADSSDTIVTGAVTANDGQMFFVVPTDTAGVTIDPPLSLLALSGSRTSAVRFEAARPAHAIPPPGGGPRTGGLATTALAVGATRASIAAIAREGQSRPGLMPIAAEFTAEIDDLTARLLRGAREGIDANDRDRLRVMTNGLVVRAAQGALTASKGAGFVAGHTVERLVRESLFFLVWSCPQAVSDAVLCDLAGID